MVSITCEAIFPKLGANFGSQARVEPESRNEVLLLCCYISVRKLSMFRSLLLIRKRKANMRIIQVLDK